MSDPQASMDPKREALRLRLWSKIEESGAATMMAAAFIGYEMASNLIAELEAQVAHYKHPSHTTEFSQMIRDLEERDKSIAELVASLGDSQESLTVLHGRIEKLRAIAIAKVTEWHEHCPDDMYARGLSYGLARGVTVMDGGELAFAGAETRPIERPEPS